MDFKVYQLFENVDYQDRETLLVDYLNQLNFFEGDHNLRYTIPRDVEYENGVLVGSISQEFIPNAFGMGENHMLENLDDFEPFERTLFALDFSTRAFLIQNKKYSPQNLDPGKTRTRLVEILNGAFRAVFESNFTAIPTRLPQDNEIYLRLINVHRVTEIKVSNLNERRVLNQTVAEDPEINRAILEVFNNDESHLDLIHLKTTAEGELNYSPLFLATIYSPNAHIEKVRYFDPEEDKLVTIDNNMLDKFVVNDINKNTESVTAYQEMITQINDNRRLLRRLRQID